MGRPIVWAAQHCSKAYIQETLANDPHSRTSGQSWLSTEIPGRANPDRPGIVKANTDSGTLV